MCSKKLVNENGKNSDSYNDEPLRSKSLMEGTDHSIWFNGPFQIRMTKTNQHSFPQSCLAIVSFKHGIETLHCNPDII